MSTSFENLPTERDEIDAELAQMRARKAELIARKRKVELEASRNVLRQAGVPDKPHTASTPPVAKADEPSDYVYGAVGIAGVTNQPVSSVYYWFAQGAYVDVNGNPAVVKLGPRTLMGYKSRLRNLKPRY
jgi:hypothetical protein